MNAGGVRFVQAEKGGYRRTRAGRADSMTHDGEPPQPRGKHLTEVLAFGKNRIQRRQYPFVFPAKR